MKTRILGAVALISVAGAAGWLAWHWLGADTGLHTSDIVVAPDGHAFPLYSRA